MAPEPEVPARFHVETLGCPKNAVDSDKVVASLLADGLAPARSAGDADLVVVNTCAFIEAARQESIDTVLALSDTKKEGSRLVVTGCLAERYRGNKGMPLEDLRQTARLGLIKAVDRYESDRSNPFVPYAVATIVGGRLVYLHPDYKRISELKQRRASV